MRGPSEILHIFDPEKSLATASSPRSEWKPSCGLHVGTAWDTGAIASLTRTLRTYIQTQHVLDRGPVM